MREEGVRQVGFHVMDVEEFDLAIAHLQGARARLTRQDVIRIGRPGDHFV